MARSVTLTTRDQVRVLTLNRVLEGALLGRLAAEQLGVSVRQARRPLAPGLARIMRRRGNDGREVPDAIDLVAWKRLLEERRQVQPLVLSVLWMVVVLEAAVVKIEPVNVDVRFHAHAAHNK